MTEPIFFILQTAAGGRACHRLPVPYPSTVIRTEALSERERGGTSRLRCNFRPLIRDKTAGILPHGLRNRLVYGLRRPFSEGGHQNELIYRDFL